MNVARRYVDLFLDSPTYGRDRANLISGFGIGTAALLLNGVVTILVFSFLLRADNPSFPDFTENVGFGTLLAVILLGGATAFATVLIPLRLVTVFMEPRTGRYFDQIVLSGISPLRFLMGKVTSQNLFLALTLFLLLPYFVLTVSLGGVNVVFFAASLFLVWLYCMSIALATLWASLYMNELLAAMMVITIAAIISVLGCFPLWFQPFVLSPFPVLSHPVYTSMSRYDEVIDRSFLPVFVSCTLCMTAFSFMSLFAIYLGPLYGIIRENSTFGEVVREGDSKRNRKFRFRRHIQRPSEITFFYANRSSGFFRNEGLVRWGLGFLGMLVLSSAGYLIVNYLTFVYVMSNGAIATRQLPTWQVFNYHGLILTIHGFGLVFATILFSHAKNTTYLLLPFFRGRTVEVSKLDTTAFLLFALFSMAASIATPFLFEQFFAIPSGTTVFPKHVDANVVQGGSLDFVRIDVESSLVIAFVGLVVYAFQRLTCLTTWLRSVAVTVTTIFSFLMIWLPLFVSVLILDVLTDARQIPFLTNAAPTIAACSPICGIVILFNGGLGPRLSNYESTVPFYLFHGVLLVFAILGIRRIGRRLRPMYLTDLVRENVGG